MELTRLALVESGKATSYPAASSSSGPCIGCKEVCGHTSLLDPGAYHLKAEPAMDCQAPLNGHWSLTLWRR